MGKAIGTWSYQRKGDSIEVELAPFEPLAPEVLDMARIKAKDLGRFWTRRTSRISRMLLSDRVYTYIE